MVRTNTLGPSHQRVPQRHHADRRWCRRRAALVASMRDAGVARRARRRRRRSSRARSPIGSIRRWQLAQAGLARCSAIRSCIVASAAAVGVLRRAAARWAAAGGGVPEQVLEHPLAALHRRGAIGMRRHRSACCPGRGGRGVRRRSRSRAGTGCRRRPGCRSAAPAARSRTCSRPCSRSRTLRSSRTMLPKNSSVSRRNRLPQVVVEVRETPSGRARRVRRLRRLQPLARRSSSTSASAFGSASMRRTCAREHRRSLQASLRPPASAARRPGCCSTGRTRAATRVRVADAVGGAGCERPRVALGAEQERRVRKHTTKRQLHAARRTCPWRGRRR